MQLNRVNSNHFSFIVAVLVVKNWRAFRDKQNARSLAQWCAGWGLLNNSIKSLSRPFFNVNSWQVKYVVFVP